MGRLPGRADETLKCNIQLNLNFNENSPQVQFQSSFNCIFCHDKYNAIVNQTATIALYQAISYALNRLYERQDCATCKEMKAVIDHFAK